MISWNQNGFKVAQLSLSIIKKADSGACFWRCVSPFQLWGPCFLCVFLARLRCKLELDSFPELFQFPLAMWKMWVRSNVLTWPACKTEPALKLACLNQPGNLEKLHWWGEGLRQGNKPAIHLMPFTWSRSRAWRSYVFYNIHSLSFSLIWNFWA